MSLWAFGVQGVEGWEGKERRAGQGFQGHAGHDVADESGGERRATHSAWWPIRRATAVPGCAPAATSHPPSRVASATTLW